jgi:acyl-CoA synthetase (AMP-forming)/AMP-acid ligase II
MSGRLLQDLLLASASARPDAVALVEGDRHATFGELAEQVDRLARFWVAAGIEPGDRVALLAHNSPFYVAAYYAIVTAGGIAVPLNTATDARSLAFFLSDSGARFLVLGAGTERTVHQAHDSLAGIELALCETPLSSPALKEAMRSVVAGEVDAGQGRLPSLTDDALASIVYTSGSTGRPRGATLSHRNLVSNALAIQSYLQLAPDDRVLAVLPFFYIYGKSVLNTHMLVGATVVIENRFLYPQAAVDSMEREACTGFSGVPSSFAILLNRTTFANHPPASLRYVTQAGGAMSPSLTRRLMEVLGERKVFIMYGATEAAGRLSYVPPEELAENVGTIGRPIDGVSFRLVREDGSPAAAGETGELVASGPNIMRGYWGDEAETAKALGEDGYRTGDLAVQTENGFYKIVGRKKDMIKAGAHRISAKEIEEAILEHDDVHEAAVVGLPDEVLGEAIWAVLVSKSGEAPTEEVTRFLRTRLPQFKQPSGIAWRAELPKSAAGKILKEPLRRELAREGRAPTWKRQEDG